METRRSIEDIRRIESEKRADDIKSLNREIQLKRVQTYKYVFSLLITVLLSMILLNFFNNTMESLFSFKFFQVTIQITLITILSASAYSLLVANKKLIKDDGTGVMCNKQADEPKASSFFFLFANSLLIIVLYNQLIPKDENLYSKIFSYSIIQTFCYYTTFQCVQKVFISLSRYLILLFILILIVTIWYFIG